MIPVSLKLKNFMTYRNPPEFEFEKLEQLTCFTGNNGHGKSSMVDSFTWCLWGEVFNRKPAGVQGKIDQALLTVGETDMYVEAVFRQNGETYKVIRSYSKGRYKEKRTLDVFCWRENNWASISSDYSSLNEREILQKIIPVTYQTFINTSYLVQGKYDEFTKKSPSKRKDLIIPLVVHPMYAVIHDQAKHVKRDLGITETTISDKIHEIQTILETRSGIQGELDTVHAILQTTQAAKTESYQKLQALIQVQARLQAQSEQEQQAQKRLDNVQKSIHRVQNQIHQATTQIGKLKTVVDDKEAIEAAYAEYQQEEEALQVLHTYELQYRDILREIDQKDNVLKLRIQKLRLEIANIEARLEALDIITKQEDATIAAYTEYQQKETETEEYDKKAVLHQEACMRRNTILEEVSISFMKLRSDCEALQKQLSGYQKLESIRHSKQCVVQAIQGLTEQQNFLVGMKNELHILGNTLEEKITALTDHKITAAMKMANVDLVHFALVKLEDGEPSNCPTCLQDIPSDRIIELQNHAETLTEEGMHFATHKSRVTREIEQLKLEQDTLKHKIDDVEEALKHLPERQAILQKYTEEEAAILQLQSEIERLAKESSQERFESELQRLTEDIDSEIATIGFSVAHVKKLSVYLVDNAFIKHAMGVLQNAKQDVATFTQTLTEKTTEYDGLVRKFKEKEHTKEEQERLKTLLGEVNACGCTINDIDTKRRELQQKKNVPERFQILQGAIVNFESSQKHLDGLNQQTDMLNEQMADLQKKATGIEATQESIKTIVQNKIEEERKHSEFQETEKQHLTVKGELQEKLDLIARKKAEQKDLYEQLFEVQKRLILNTHLVEICGREGVPTHLLKQTIESVEFEANDILDRITEGTTRLTLETEKKLKSGDIRDTLDIKIQTDGYDRYYEPYSGGQKFRIDFALRIGLSKVLATQAGNPLEFLVIDEGFGTQDDNGLTQVVQALKEIQSDFKQVVIITHISKLQELFGTRVNFQLDPIKGTQFSYV